MAGQLVRVTTHLDLSGTSLGLALIVPRPRKPLSCRYTRMVGYHTARNEFFKVNPLIE